MNLEDYTEDVIKDDLDKLHYLYQLKQVIRSDLKREASDLTESVADHVYGMHLLAQYFLPLENPENDWDKALIYELITLHDIDEVVTGDIVGWKKTTADRGAEEAALPVLLENTPTILRDKLSEKLEQYKQQKLPEATFVKAIDKIEPHVHFMRETHRPIFDHNKITAEQAQSIKVRYLEGYPFIQKLNNYIHEQMITEGYYWDCR